MSDVTFVALIGAISTISVGVAAALAQVFGPAWRDAKMRKLEAELAAEDARYQRARALVDAANEHYLGHLGARIKLEKARAGFVSTLRPGEGEVEGYVNHMLSVERETAAARTVGMMLAGGLFAYLRGDVTIEELRSRQQPIG